jgi:hypothetical protein
MPTVTHAKTRKKTIANIKAIIDDYLEAFPDRLDQHMKAL